VLLGKNSADISARRILEAAIFYNGDLQLPRVIYALSFHPKAPVLQAATSQSSQRQVTQRVCGSSISHVESPNHVLVRNVAAVVMVPKNAQVSLNLDLTIREAVTIQRVQRHPCSVSTRGFGGRRRNPMENTDKVCLVHTAFHQALEVDTRCRSILRSAESKLNETSWELAKQVAEGDTRERESLSTSHSTSSIDSLSD